MIHQTERAIEQIIIGIAIVESRFLIVLLLVVDHILNQRNAAATRIFQSLDQPHIVAIGNTLKHTAHLGTLGLLECRIGHQRRIFARKNRTNLSNIDIVHIECHQDIALRAHHTIQWQAVSNTTIDQRRKSVLDRSKQRRNRDRRTDSFEQLSSIENHLLARI